MTSQEDPAEQPATPSHISPFERIRQAGDDGGEYWLARDLATVLDYSQWRNFEQAIERAIRAARNSGQDPADHFAEVSKMITAGKGARRKVKDYQLSRYACYLIIRAPVTGHHTSGRSYSFPLWSWGMLAALP